MKVGGAWMVAGGRMGGKGPQVQAVFGELDSEGERGF